MEKIRILQIVNYMGRGGLETMLMNYYRHIDREKFQFDFLTHRNQEAEYDQEIQNMGGIIYRVPRVNPLSFSYHKEEMDVFLRHKYRIAHCHMDCMSAFPLYHAKKAGVPIRIAHSHNKDQKKDIKYPVKMICKGLIPRVANQLFACGTEAGNFMFGNHPFKIMKNAIKVKDYVFNDQVRNQVRQEFNLSNNIVLGNVANFSKQKNHTFLLDIFSIYHEMHKNSKLLLVGDGTGRTRIEEKICKLGLQDDVIMTGVRSDVNRILQAMDVFVFPSLYEGLGIVAIEAQASGLPCIISDEVPEEAIVTELVRRLPLSEDAGIWASEIDKVVNVKRTNQEECIKQKGYDILSNTKWLEEFYLKVYSENGYKK